MVRVHKAEIRTEESVYDHKGRRKLGAFPPKQDLLDPILQPKHRPNLTNKPPKVRRRNRHAQRVPRTQQRYAAFGVGW